MFNSKCYVFKNNKYSDRKVSHRYMHNCSLPSLFYLCLRHGFSSHTHRYKKKCWTQDVTYGCGWKERIILFLTIWFYISQIDGRWHGNMPLAVTWMRTQGLCSQRSDPAGCTFLPLAVSMTTKSPAHYRPLLLNIWLTDVQMSTTPSQVNSPGVLHVHFLSFTCTLYAAWQGHRTCTQFIFYFLHECLYVLLLLFELTSALAALLSECIFICDPH